MVKYKIGELIELVQEINSELKYGSDDVRGMTITKEIIPTKADVSGTDLSKFLVVHPREFIYNPRACLKNKNCTNQMLHFPFS